MTADMWRGVEDGPVARESYQEHHAPVREIGLLVRDDWGFPIGCSPDGLVGDDGMIEIKSRLQRHQLLTVLDDGIPAANIAQTTNGAVGVRPRVDHYVSFCGGCPSCRDPSASPRTPAGTRDHRRSRSFRGFRCRHDQAVSRGDRWPAANFRPAYAEMVCV